MTSNTVTHTFATELSRSRLLIENVALSISDICKSTLLLARIYKLYEGIDSLKKYGKETKVTQLQFAYPSRCQDLTDLMTYSCKCLLLTYPNRMLHLHYPTAYNRKYPFYFYSLCKLAPVQHEYRVDHFPERLFCRDLKRLKIQVDFH